MIHPALTVFCTAALLAVIPALSVLYREFLDRVGWRSSAVLTLIVSASGFVLWMIVSLVLPGIAGSPLQFPAAALAAVASFLASLPVRDSTARALPAVIFSSVWTIVVFVPVTVVVLFPAAAGLDPALTPLDLGGTLPVHLAVGTGALVVLTLARRWTVADHSHIRPRSWLLFGTGLVLWGGWTAGLVGLEGAIDPAITTRIVVNCVAAPAFAILGWLIIQRVRSRVTNGFGAVAGLLSGLVAITAGAAFFTPLWASVTGAVAGIACSLFASGRIRSTGRHAWFIVAVHLVGGFVGLVMLGLFGAGIGLIYTGQTGLFVTQFVSTVAVVVWAGSASLLLWLVVGAVARRSALRVAT